MITIKTRAPGPRVFIGLNQDKRFRIRKDCDGQEHDKWADRVLFKFGNAQIAGQSAAATCL